MSHIYNSYSPICTNLCCQPQFDQSQGQTNVVIKFGRCGGNYIRCPQTFFYLFCGTMKVSPCSRFIYIFLFQMPNPRLRWVGPLNRQIPVTQKVNIKLNQSCSNSCLQFCSHSHSWFILCSCSFSWLSSFYPLCSSPLLPSVLPGVPMQTATSPGVWRAPLVCLKNKPPLQE